MASLISALNRQPAAFVAHLNAQRAASEGVRAAGSDADCSVETVTDHAAFIALQPLWSRLIEQARIDHPFVRHEWLRTWWNCFGRDYDLDILVVRHRTEPVAIAPFMSCK